MKVDVHAGTPVKIFAEGVPIADNAHEQIRNTAAMPFVKHMAVMPDAHWGMGATVGTVAATEKAIIPAAVGVDIGCGMNAVRTDVRADQLPDALGGLRDAIEEAIPHGRTRHGGLGDKGSWRGRAPADVVAAWNESLKEPHREIVERSPKAKSRDPMDQLGTLGGGNHFVEVCLDLDDNVWIMLHSGSRGAGNRIGTSFISKAKKEMERWFVSLPDQDLAYLPQGSEQFGLYVSAVSWAQEYARINRELMMDHALEALEGFLGKDVSVSREQAVNCHHNYIAKESHHGRSLWVTRKGAVRAREGDLGIIPGSMGAKSFIVRGKGNAHSLHSCSHGAGRVMSRNEARRQFTQDDLQAQTQGVECRKDADVVDEIPGAYKDIDTVMAAQTDLVDVVAQLRQVVCVKG